MEESSGYGFHVIKKIFGLRNNCREILSNNEILLYTRSCFLVIDFC